MRTMLAASLILVCTCAQALDDTPTQNVVMGPRAEDVRTPAPVRLRQERPSAHRGHEAGEDGRRGVRPAPAPAPVAASSRQGVLPWLTIRQGVPTGRSAQR